MTSARADVLIIGGGVAGLWARAALRRSGWSVILSEPRALGAGQTAASQGILHRGVKYALSADAREASNSLASAQADWRGALGLLEHETAPMIDLRGTEILSRRMHLWASGFLEKATGVGASLSMRSEVRRLARPDYPPAFRESPQGLALWEVDELSVSASSLVERLADAADGPVVHARTGGQPTWAGSTHSNTVCLRGDGGRACDITASAVVLAAGEGNEGLLGGLGGEGIMQRRPLHMVIADGAPVPLFAHLPRPGSDKPRLTITSARTFRGWCWYIGGDVAETGVARSREEQINFAKRELSETLGWIDLSPARWSAFRIDRAEGRTEAGRRPDGPVVRRFGRVLAVWPTKLALAPIAARMIQEQLRELGVVPGVGACENLAGWPRPPVAQPPWNDPELVWT
ncbi:MAG: FAD-dependent oxidoreductase [Phycisphaerales bacterium]|nr:FAD-dependent oxidoreductase [Phycisphaerales bacterium]